MHYDAAVQSHRTVHGAHSPLFSFLSQASQALAQRALLKIFVKLESPVQPSLLTPFMLSDTVLDLSLPTMPLPDRIRTFPFIYHPLCPLCPTFFLSIAIPCFAKHAQPVSTVW